MLVRPRVFTFRGRRQAKRLLKQGDEDEAVVMAGGPRASASPAEQSNRLSLTHEHDAGAKNRGGRKLQTGISDPAAAGCYEAASETIATAHPRRNAAVRPVRQESPGRCDGEPEAASITQTLRDAGRFFNAPDQKPQTTSAAADEAEASAVAACCCGQRAVKADVPLRTPKSPPPRPCQARGIRIESTRAKMR